MMGTCNRKSRHPRRGRPFPEQIPAPQRVNFLDIQPWAATDASQPAGDLTLLPLPRQWPKAGQLLLAVGGAKVASWPAFPLRCDADGVGVFGSSVSGSFTGSRRAWRIKRIATPSDSQHLGLLRDLQGVFDLDAKVFGPCFPICDGRIAVGRLAGSSSAGRSRSPWCAAASGCRSPPGRARPSPPAVDQAASISATSSRRVPCERQRAYRPASWRRF